MTLVIYEPETPAMEFIGHAGAGLYGQDPVCAALSILLYTLAASVPEARASFGDGWARVEGPKPQIGARGRGFDLEKEEGGSGNEGERPRPDAAGAIHESPAELQPHTDPRRRGGYYPPAEPRTGQRAADSRPYEATTQRASSDAAAYAFAATGVRLLAEHDPQHVRLEVKS